MARIFSVAIPAIILTFLLDSIGQSVNLAAYSEGYQAMDYAPVRAVSSLFFLNEIWLLGIQLFSNVPYWSLNYEVWYYVGFALVYYIGGIKGKFLFLLLMLFLGPKVVLLMPLWWLGVYIYKSKFHNNISLLTAWGLVVISLLSLSLFMYYGLSGKGWDFLKALMGNQWHRELSFSRNFITDYFLGIIIAINFIGMRAVCSYYSTIPQVIESPIRYLASSTFTLYLLHQPLLLFVYSFLYVPELDLSRYLLMILLTLLSVFFIAHFTEQKKYIWKKWITIYYEAISRRLSSKFFANK